METILDTYANTNALRSVDTRVKLLFGIGSIFLCISSQSVLVPLCIAALMAIVVIGQAKIPLRLYLGLIAIPFSFAVFSSIVILFMTGGGDLLLSLPIWGIQLNATTGGANLSILLLCRTFSGMSSLFFIALTTPVIDLFSLMQQWYFPQVLIDLSMLIYHFIFIFIGEAILIHNAQAMRLGYGNFRKSLNSFAMLGGMLFIRAWESGEELVLAMDARCYNGKLNICEDKRPIPVTLLIVVVCYLILFSLVSLGTRHFVVI